jgi:hypothetical protein
MSWLLGWSATLTELLGSIVLWPALSATSLAAQRARSVASSGANRRDHADMGVEFDVLIEIPRQPKQVRARPQERPDPPGPDAVQGHPVPGRLRIRGGHPGIGRRPPRRIRAGTRTGVPRLSHPVTSDRDVPDDRREGRGRQSPLCTGRRPVRSTCATSGTCPNSTGSRSSTSWRSTKT